jgi:type II secretory pathway component PulK
MNRRGFALLAVLWVVVSATLLAGLAMTAARLGADASRNRILLLRSRWAGDACAEILSARYAVDGDVRVVDTVDLGGGVWCRAELHDPDTRLDLNLGSPSMVRAFLADDSLSDALLDWRDADDEPRPFGAEAPWYRSAGRRAPRNGPLAHVDELAYIRGFERWSRGERDTLFTVDGTGRVNLLSAPDNLVRGLPGVGAEARKALASRRASGMPVRTLEELISLLSSKSGKELLASYDALRAASAFEPSRLVARVEGGIAGAPVSNMATLVAVPAGSRLAVVRRVAE